MGLPILRILRRQRPVLDDQYVLRVLLLRRLAKLTLPVRTASPSTTMTLLGEMAWLTSMFVGTPWLARKSAEEYFSVRWLLSRITCTCSAE